MMMETKFLHFETKKFCDLLVKFNQRRAMVDNKKCVPENVCCSYMFI